MIAYLFAEISRCGVFLSGNGDCGQKHETRDDHDPRN